MKKWLLSLSFVFLGFLVGVIFYLSPQPAQPDHPVPSPFTEADLAFQKNYVQDHYYVGVDGTQNYYALIEEPRNAIKAPLIIVTGLEDLPENWWRTAQSALQLGFQRILIVELRGQGHSERVPHNFNRANHVNKFSDYTSDLLLFLQALQQRWGAPPARPYMITHSTGSLVLTASLEKIKQKLPKYLPQRMVLWSPLIRPEVSPLLNNAVVRPVLQAVDTLGRQMGRTVLGRRFSLLPFEKNRVTYDKERYEWAEAVRVSQGLNSSGVSLHWALETFPVAEKMLADNYSVIEQPTLILLAGDDVIVSNDWDLNNPFIQKREIQNSKHALHIETQEVFEQAITETFRFLLAKSLRDP